MGVNGSILGQHGVERARAGERGCEATEFARMAMNRWTTRARKGAHAADTLQGPTVLTVTGAVGKPNRPAFDPFTDAFLKVRGVSFTGAHAFDRASLAALPQASITARIESWPAAVSARGRTCAHGLCGCCEATEL